MYYVISGLGGIGKSTLATVYARKHCDYYHRNGIWINAETDESLRNSLVTFITKRLNVSEEDATNISDANILHMIYHHFKSSKCLIILDNVEEEKILQLLPKDFEPDSLKPFILITSRISKWRVGVRVLHLDVLTMDEALEFVGKSITESNCTDEGKKLLASTLQCLPLALQQAVAYIRAELSENPNPIRRYLELFESVRLKELLHYNHDELDTNEKTTLLTWSVTMNKIQNERVGSLAIRIMNLLSYFEPESIPIKMACSFFGNFQFTIHKYK